MRDDLDLVVHAVADAQSPPGEDPGRCALTMRATAFIGSTRERIAHARQ